MEGVEIYNISIKITFKFLDYSENLIIQNYLSKDIAAYVQNICLNQKLQMS